MNVRAGDPATRIAGPAIAGLAAITTLALRAGTPGLKRCWRVRRWIGSRDDRCGVYEAYGHRGCVRKMRWIQRPARTAASLRIVGRRSRGSGQLPAATGVTANQPVHQCPGHIIRIRAAGSGLVDAVDVAEDFSKDGGDPESSREDVRQPGVVRAVGVRSRQPGVSAPLLVVTRPVARHVPPRGRPTDTGPVTRSFAGLSAPGDT